MTLTIADLEQLQSEHPDLQFELWDGEIIIMSGSDHTSGVVAGRFFRFLDEWVEPRDLGFVTDSSGAYTMPDGNILVPDAAFTSVERLAESPRQIADLVPDLAVEVKSSTNRVKRQQTKVEKYLEYGVKVSIFVDPDKRTVTVYRPNADVTVLSDADILTVPELLPGWELQISRLWPKLLR